MLRWSAWDDTMPKAKLNSNLPSTTSLTRQNKKQKKKKNSIGRAANPYRLHPLWWSIMDGANAVNSFIMRSAFPPDGTTLASKLNGCRNSLLDAEETGVVDSAGYCTSGFEKHFRGNIQLLPGSSKVFSSSYPP